MSGVTSGVTVKLFSDSTCDTEIGSGTASGSSVDVTVSSSFSVSTHTIYANATNLVGSSPCSSVSVSYELSSCPEDYVAVPHDTSVGTTHDFCVLQTEFTTGVLPWTGYTPEGAQGVCLGHNAILGVVDKYDIISNAEWMTIARNIEAQKSNWSGGEINLGMLNRGHSDNDPDYILEVPRDYRIDPYTQTDNDSSEDPGSGWEQKRTHVLSNGEVIWDFSGNAWEWVDWDMNTSGFQLGPTTCSASEFSLVSCPEIEENEYLPATNGGSSKGLGYFLGGSGGAARRGGDWSLGAYTGVFMINLGDDLTSTGASYGFRCVYRPYR